MNIDIMAFLEKLITKVDSGEILKLFLIIAALITVNIFCKKYILSFSNKAKKSKNKFNKIFISNLTQPLLTLISIQLSITFIDVLNDSISIFKSTQFIDKIRLLIFIGCISHYLYKITTSIESLKIQEMTLKNRLNDRTSVRAIAKLLKILLILFSSIVVLDILGINISGLVTIASIGTVTIGFAAKDLVANFFGTIVIHLDNPFKEGDWISSPEKNIEGIVEEINWRMTKLRTFERRPIYVQNNIFSNIVIQNNTRMYNRRFKTDITLRYKDFSLVEKVAKSIKAYVDESPHVDHEQFKFVNLNEFANYSINITVLFFTKETKWIEFQAIRQEMLLDIGKIINDLGADFAFPTTTIDIPDIQNILSDKK